MNEIVSNRDLADALAAEKTKHRASEPLSIRLVQRSPTNPRRHFPEDAHAELTESVKKYGVLQPILVRVWPPAQKWDGGTMPVYEIVAGERRYRAATAAGLTVIPGIVRDLTDLEVLEIQIIENLQREELHPLEEAEGYELLMKKHAYTADDLAAKIGKSKAYVYARLKLTALCKEAREAFYAGSLVPSTALLVARIPVPALQQKALEGIAGNKHTGPMSARDAAAYIQRTFMLRLSDAPFPRGDGTLLPGTPRCHECAKRTGNQPELFEDVASADVCTDPECFDAKRKVHFERVKRQAKEDGRKVLLGKEAKKIAPYGTGYGELKDGYMALDRECYEVPSDKNHKHPTYRQLLGNDWKAPALIEDERTGNLVEIAQKKDVVAALKEKGIDVNRQSSGSRDPEQKERERKAKLEAAARKAIFEAIREKAPESSAHMTLDPKPVKILAHATAAFFGQLGSDSSTKILRLWLEDFDGKDWWETAKAFGKSITMMGIEDLVPLLTDMSLIGELAVSPWGLDKKPERLHATAELHGIDAQVIRKRIVDEEKAKAAAKDKKKAPAAKKNTPAAKLKVGDRVRIKDGLKGANGKARKCCGRVGMIDAINGSEHCVRIGPKAHEVVVCLQADELEAAT
ncbi:MAG: ParB/RepB/Spo0J family partition protein [Betaproteobacteria bacterium]|nr:ParB/RepB/Spo0J family partition protein [Betaproteobacteria bacterium]